MIENTSNKILDDGSDDALSIENIARNLPGNIVRRLLHPDGRFSYAFLSDGLSDTFDIDPDEITVLHNVDFHWIHPEDRQPFVDALHASAANLTPLDVENRVIGRHGQIRWVRSISTTRRLKDGTVVWDGVALDITDKKNAEAEMQAALAAAEKADKAKTQFLAAASHDLRQPLQAMRFHLAGLRNAPGFSAPQDKFAEVERCVDSMEALLHSLLDISKLDAGMVDPRPETVDLADFAAGLVTEMTPTAEAAGVTLDADRARGLVSADPTLLATICRNLLENAIKYNRDGGRVLLRARAFPTPRILVADTGIGFSGLEKEKIFEPFAQLTNEARDRSFGLGLGLAIVSRIAHLTGARIAVRSKPGTGTVFSVTMPGTALAANGHVPAPKSAASAARTALDGKHVWILEDDLDVQKSLADLLTGWGMTVRTAGSARQLDALVAEKERSIPDAIIADFRLPSVRTGGKAMADVREQLRKDIPGIILTGDTDPARIKDAQSSGSLVLFKPVKAGRLKAALRSCLENSA